MSTDASYPINFDLSSQAIDVIEKMTVDAEKRDGISYCPCIMWAYNLGNTPNTGGICIGFIEKAKVKVSSLSKVDNFRFIYGVIQRDQKHFDGKTLDVRGDQLILAV